MASQTTSQRLDSGSSTGEPERRPLMLTPRGTWAPQPLSPEPRSFLAIDPRPASPRLRALIERS
jgi:hypothetical protein